VKRGVKQCERETPNAQCSIMNSTICWNKWKYEFERCIQKKKCNKESCVVDTTKHMFEIWEWKKELEALMGIHCKKQLDLNGQLRSLQLLVERIVAHPELLA
jgi:hypothetical protein